MNTNPGINRYLVPGNWISYSVFEVAQPLIEAKSAAQVLNRLPYLSQWIEEAREEQLRLEAAGTTRIEGAVFSESEQEQALSHDPKPVVDLTHSQRQLRCANATYRWIATLPASRPVNAELILNIHRRMVTGCDDDHCEPGAIRRSDVEATFGVPPCRGARGGEELAEAMKLLVAAISREYRGHDRIIQAIAAHYHLGAMHPFGDGNGRTARAVEAHMLRAAGVNGQVFVSLSNYYYEHQDRYLEALYETRRHGHDLTPILKFGLGAIESQCNRLADEVLNHNKRVLGREFAHSLFGKLRSQRRRALGERQLAIIRTLLDAGPLPLPDLVNRVRDHYADLKYPNRALLRDLNGLFALDALEFEDGQFSIDLDWPQKYSESELLERFEKMPSASSHRSLIPADLSRLLGRTN